MRPKVLRQLYPGIGTLHNASGLLDLRELAGWDRCLLLLHSFAQADLEEMMSKKKELGSWGVSGATDRNIHKGLAVVLGPIFPACMPPQIRRFMRSKTDPVV